MEKLTVQTGKPSIREKALAEIKQAVNSISKGIFAF